MIKGYEGFVRKINFRCTRIETIFREDVIIPNSDLISSPIINYEFESSFIKVKCPVGVAYGSDLDLVKNTLLEVAAKNPDVLNDPLNKPIVFLNQFGDNNLLFELSCVIKNVNRKSDVISDLNFAIAKEFAEKKIEMSFQQHDVRIIQDK